MDSSPQASHSVLLDYQRWRRIFDGDGEAFKEVMREYGPMLVRFAYHYVKSDDLAQEIVQDVFVSLWERRPHLTPSLQLKSYLFKVIAMTEKLVSSTLNQRAKNPKSELNIIDTEAEKIKGRIKSLLIVAESGVRLEEISTRLRELEAEQERLELKRQTVGANPLIGENSQDIASKVREFFSSFTQRFHGAPISERKALLNQLVERIVIDRERSVAKCTF